VARTYLGRHPACSRGIVTKPGAPLEHAYQGAKGTECRAADGCGLCDLRTALWVLGRVILGLLLCSRGYWRKSYSLVPLSTLIRTTGST
jgi:hypothetical protein